MKTKLTLKETLVLSITLFGMFFGAGNLIFPVHLGQLAGSNVISATLGFIVTGVTIPILAVASIGVTHSNGLQRMCEKKVGMEVVDAICENVPVTDNNGTVMKENQPVISSLRMITAEEAGITE